MTIDFTSRDNFPTVGFVSLGCAKNRVDSEIIASSLLAHGIPPASSPEKADIVLVNTCSFIRDAREESIEAVLDACRLKKRGVCRAVIVAGCLPQRYKQRLKRNLPDVDAFVGLDQIKSVAEIVRRVASGERNILEVSPQAGKTFEPDFPRVLFTGGPVAYLKIADGCNHRCSFCAIPAIRGRYRSRLVPNIAREAEYLLAKGVRELNLVAQDTTCYGRDLNDGTDLPRLLRALGRIGGKFRIRVLYGYPTRITSELLDAMGEIPQVCKYLDIPIQHSHPEMLRLMRRSATVRNIEGMTGRLRGLLPGIAVRTTCLVGHPGETDDRFRHLLRYVKDAAFDHLGTFVYSPEEGTTAIRIPRRVRPNVAESRIRDLMLAQKKIVDGRARSLIGKREEILLERRVGDSSRRWMGRSAAQAPEIDGCVHVCDAPERSRPGDFLVAEYTARRGYDMIASAIRDKR